MKACSIRVLGISCNAVGSGSSVLHHIVVMLPFNIRFNFYMCVHAHVRVHVCVCVCKRDRQRERERERERALCVSNHGSQTMVFYSLVLMLYAVMNSST